MKNELIVDAISLVNPFAGLATKYLFKIASNPNNKILNNEIDKIKLTKLELEFINYILNIASFEEKSIDNIRINCGEIKEKLKLNENDFSDIRYSLESYQFLSVEEGMGSCDCILNYSIFWKSDYLELTTQNTLNFEWLLKSMIDYLYLEKRHSTEEVNIPEISTIFTNEQINPILAYLDEMKISKNIMPRYPQTKYIYYSFFLDKANLINTYKRLQ